MEITFSNNKAIIENIDHFDLKHTFECGQCFRWNEEEDGSYTGIAFGKILNVKKDNNVFVFSDTNKEDFENIWFNYFDLGRNYGEIKSCINRDEMIEQAIEFGSGIRILNQELWETIVSFIISANNNIPRIKKSIEMICERYGEYIGTYKGQKRFSFPDANILKELREEDLKECNTGYRAGYIIESAKIFSNERTTLDLFKELNSEMSLKELTRFSGVGPKVAHCINVFALGKRDAFPVDVWIKRIVEHLYFKEITTPRKIQDFAYEKFGLNAGYAQQYLFYYARELNLGKEK
ncbi:DNA-3-methyladenine glycosylase family protein [Serpentinicella alkaliphila]|uniref:DNA-(apurinic or apyrimidinic site) lyase n=1 Tax=Serpentinicella alkaliphila TaxID=1734049 RepID=A0A4R2TQ36_9FIRM|nr:DNA glycosylase [Serpentinicella alkaliphila]QUH24863.1 8-oxoguanine DNA glycosylase [Serpentinicella alkaliphila]TCQ03425.1 N-glycosylase/DNA lyase [Serpentinicella alkaliphila]